MTTTLSPEFCYSNFIDLDINSHVSITATPTDNWWSDNLAFLYDHYQGEVYNNGYRKVLFSKDADSDSTSVYLTIDFGEDIFIDTIKILNTNIKGYIFSKSDDGVTYTSFYSDTDNDEDSIHWHTPVGAINGYLLTESGLPLGTEAGALLGLETYYSMRYLKITLTTTQIPNEEKFLGELYVGRRAFKPSSAKVLSYKFDYEDPRKDELTTYQGYRVSQRVNASMLGSIVYSRPNLDEFNFIKKINTYGGNFDFFPTGGELGSEVDRSLTKSDIYYITARGNLNINAWSNNAKGAYQLDIMETRNVL